MGRCLHTYIHTDACVLAQSYSCVCYTADLWVLLSSVGTGTCGSTHTSQGRLTHHEELQLLLLPKRESRAWSTSPISVQPVVLCTACSAHTIIHAVMDCTFLLTHAFTHPMMDVVGSTATHTFTNPIDCARGGIHHHSRFHRSDDGGGGVHKRHRRAGGWWPLNAFRAGGCIVAKRSRLQDLYLNLQNLECTW